MNLRRLGTTIGGSLGGVLGTAVMQQGMKLAPKLPSEWQPPQPSQDPGEFMISHAEKLAGRSLSPRLHKLATMGLHWGYGTFWATLYAAASKRVAKKGLGRAATLGALMGAGVWAIGYVGWLPAVGLTPPVEEQGRKHSLTALASHMLYGIAAMVPAFLGGKIGAFGQRRFSRRRFLPVF